MIDEDERNWKTGIEARAAEDSRRLWSQCAAAGCVAVFLSPLAMFAIVALGGVLEGRWPTHLALGEILGRSIPVYGVSLLVSLPASVPSAIVFAVATYKLSKSGYLNWLTSATVGALIGALVGVVFSLAALVSKAPHELQLALVGFTAPVGALTTLATYVLCLRRIWTSSTAP